MLLGHRVAGDGDFCDDLAETVRPHDETDADLWSDQFAVVVGVGRGHAVKPVPRCVVTVASRRSDCCWLITASNLF